MKHDLARRGIREKHTAKWSPKPWNCIRTFSTLKQLPFLLITITDIERSNQRGCSSLSLSQIRTSGSDHLLSMVMGILTSGRSKAEVSGLIVRRRIMLMPLLSSSNVQSYFRNPHYMHDKWLCGQWLHLSKYLSKGFSGCKIAIYD